MMKKEKLLKKYLLTAAAFLLLSQGFAAARMSDDELLYLYYSRYAPEKVKTDNRFAGRALDRVAPGRGIMDATMVRLAVVRNWDYLEPETRAELSRYIEVSPPRNGRREVSASAQDCESLLSGISTSTSSENFIVYYTTSSGSQHAVPSPATAGVPDYVINVLQYSEEVRDRVVGTLGFTSPPAASGKYPVYLCDLMGNSGGTLLGRTVTTTLNGNSASSYLELDNDYNGYQAYSDSVENLLKSTVAHEFFHAVQFGLNYRYPSFWMLESTAVWMESEVYPAINDWISLYMFSRFSNLDIPLDYFSFDDVYGYGMGIFFKYLSEKVGGSASMKAIWDLVENDTQDCTTAYPCDPSDEITEIPQISSYLATKNTTLNAVVKNFHAANYAKDYTVGSALPNVSITGSYLTYPASDSQESLDHLAAKFFKFTPTSTTLAKKLTLSFTGGSSASSWGATMALKQPDGTYQTNDITLTAKAGSISIDGFGTYYTEAVLIVTNLDTSKTNSDVFSFTASLSDSCSSTETSNSFPSGWNMVTFPVIPLNGDPSLSVKVVSTGNFITDNAIYYFSPTANTPYPGSSSSFLNLGTTGQGYWVNITAASALSLVSCLPSDTTLDVELATGWNMFGNPFTTDVNWADNKVSVIPASSSSEYTLSDAVSNGWIAPKLYWYNGSGYTEILPNNGADIGAWKAYWLKTYGNVTLRIKQ